MRKFVFAAAAAISLAAAGPATGAPRPLPGPDLPGQTPDPALRSGAGASSGCSALRAHLHRGGQASGLFVMNAESGRVLCRSNAHRRRILASNMKLFTTATALARLGPDHRLPTSLWRVGRVDGRGTLQGSLYLVGGGDPVLTSPIFAERNLGGVHTNIYDLVASVKAAGIRRVTGRVLADATIFDSRRGVADSGYETSPYIGPLSGLSFNMGFTTSLANRFSASPEKLAGLKLMKALETSGVEIARGIAERPLPSRRPRARLGVLESPTLDSIVNTTNVYSVNFMAEMLIKGLGARFGGTGSTARGAGVVEAFARTLGSGVRATDGSGLTRTNRASPAEVGRLLAGMRIRRGASRFVDSLPIAGREGTLADRMEGTAAAGRCRAKTGTIIGVSALSGYCFNRSGKQIVFSILMNGVWSTDRARLAQDRIAALIARY
jgi:D-alanyl-D-alanine carboxypeptidase/D-alanyl-D-alanine-endopeptidase (penicillin-binding protein 4)